MKEASDETELYDYGNEQFVEPITRFVHSAVDEAHLTPAGLAGLDLEVKRWLVNRLRFQGDLTRHPEILDEDVSDPIVVVGIPRTGTTKLQRMLGADPGVQTLPFWRNLNPAPFPGVASEDVDPRLVAAQGYVDVLRAHFPDVMDLHTFAADEPEEEVLMLEMTGRSLSSCLFYRTPTFFSWLIEQPQQPLYEELRRLLQYQQWQNGGRQNRPWILKSPMHLGRIDALLDIFPQATIVHCHRDISTSMTSICNLVRAVRVMRADPVDPIELGQFLLEFLSGEWEKNLEQRARVGREGQILDIPYERIRDAAVDVIREIYARHHRTLSAETEDRMVAWERRNQARSGGYPYPAEYYGLTEAAVSEGFARYRDHFVRLPMRPPHRRPE